MFVVSFIHVKRISLRRSMCHALAQGLAISSFIVEVFCICWWNLIAFWGQAIDLASLDSEIALYSRLDKCWLFTTTLAHRIMSEAWLLACCIFFKDVVHCPSNIEWSLKTLSSEWPAILLTPKTKGCHRSARAVTLYLQSTASGAVLKHAVGMLQREQRAPVCDLRFFPALHLFILAYLQASGGGRSLGVAGDTVGTSVLGLIL